jgi:hypothetical protein
MWFIVAYALTLTYIIADVFEHLNDPLTWRLPFVLVLIILGIVTVKSLRDYFLNADIGDT